MTVTFVTSCGYFSCMFIPKTDSCSVELYTLYHRSVQIHIIIDFVVFSLRKF